HISGGALISASDSIFVGHFMKGDESTLTGDASFTLVTPISHMRCDHQFYSFYGYDFDDTGPPSETQNGSYVNIVARSADIDDLLLDGQALSGGGSCLDYTRTDYVSGGWSWARCLLSDPPSG